MNPLPDDLTDINLDPQFQQQVKKLHQLTVYARWIVVLILWMTVGIISIHGFNYPITLLRENFTWAALKYGIYGYKFPALGLGLCIGMTCSVLIWQTRNLIFGLPQSEKQKLQQQVYHIRQQGSTHPLWKLICRDK